MAAKNTVTFFVGSRLHRASWLRESSAYLNQAVCSTQAKFILLDHGNPVVRTDGTKESLALFSWRDVKGTVLGMVHKCGNPNTADVYGPAAYDLKARDGEENAKLFQSVTKNIVSPALSLVFLGIDGEGVDSIATYMTLEGGNGRTLAIPPGSPYFALSLSFRAPGTQDKTLGDALLEKVTNEGYEVLDMRIAIVRGGLDKEDSAIVAYARTLLDWNERYTHCPGCGSRQFSAWGGHKRTCGSVVRRTTQGTPAVLENVHTEPVPASVPVCASVKSLQNYSYPRTDPVVVLGIVRHDGDAILLGRQAMWPKGLYSCPAGFVEPGETLEEAVRREGIEETGIKIDSVVYYSSQPWPLPANLMFGMFGVAAKDQPKERTDLDAELSDVFYATREQVQAAVNAAAKAQGAKKNTPTHNGEKFLYVHHVSHGSIPPPTAIAYHLLAAFARGEAPSCHETRSML